MADRKYDKEDILVLEEIEHLRLNPGMYVGSTENPNHLLYEVFDNALDEANAKCATLIAIVINTQKNTCTISDNGRGIPISDDIIPIIATKLFSGGKFKKGETNSAYGIAAGLHGVGLVAVTALSDWVEIIVYRDNQKALYKFVDAKIDKKDISEHPSKNRPFSTQIAFNPSKRFFESIDFDVNPIRERLKLASIHIPHLKLILVIDGKKEIINCNIDQYFKDALLKGKVNSNITPIFPLRKKIKDEEVVIKFAWDMSIASTPKHSGCVNLLSVNQGSHINRTYTVFRNVFEEFAKREKLTFKPQDCFVGLRFHVSMSLYRPEYTSQTKEKLSTSKAKLDHLFKDLEKQLIVMLDKYSQTKTQLLGFFESYRKGLSTNKNIVKGGSKVTRFNQVIDSKLKDCTTHTVENSELFITEGASAAGGLVKCRNPKFHALLGLKGKIPNLAGTKKDFLKNKEVVEIVNSLGTGVIPDFNALALRYGKIIIATDADADGAHITTLLMVLFLKLVPDLLKNESRIYRAIMPLYGATIKGKFLPIFTEEDLAKFKVKFPKIEPHRYKGLGEMNPDQLKYCLLDKNSRRLESVTYPEDPLEIFKIMTDAETKRGLIE